MTPGVKCTSYFLLQPLECLYLDCTYGDKVFVFPTKEEAIRQVCDFIACQTEDTQQIYLACDQLGMEEVRARHRPYRPFRFGSQLLSAEVADCRNCSIPLVPDSNLKILDTGV
jgi:hypothetical protein